MKYSLTLYIADIKMDISLDERQEYIFLKYKFQKYLLPTSSPTSPRSGKSAIVSAKYTIELGHHQRKKYQKQGSTYHFFVLPLRTHFELFNELLRSVLIIELADHQGLIIHASSLIQTGQAWVFMGKPGAGKSTMRSLYPEKKCLGDDTAIIRLIGSTPYLYGSPFYERTELSYPNQKFPLHGLYAVKLSNHYFLQKLSFPEDAKIFIQQSFLPGATFLPSLKKKIFSTALDISQLIPIYRLIYKKSRQVVPFVTASSKLLQYWNQKKSHSAILKKLDPIVRTNLPRQLSWRLFTASVEYLKTCQVIDAVSWNFEFSSAKSIKSIARQVFDQGLASGHGRLIRKKAMHSITQKEPFVLLENTLIDGNHRAIALYHQYTQPRREVLSFLFYQGLPAENYTPHR